MATTIRSEGTRSGQLLEREEALDDLMASLSETRTGTGRLVIVSGEAGIGKTALVRAFCESVRSSDQVLEGACDPLFTPRPLGPFADVAARTGGALAEHVERGAGAHEVLAAIRDVLHARPTVLVLEDVHWADEATLDVVRMLGRRIDGLPALVILTYRDDELDRSHPLRLVLGELATGRGVVRVPLRPLSPEAVAELAHGSGIDAGELYRTTTGNPFYVSEVLAGGGGEIPPTVRDAVFARVARLCTSATAIVEAVSIAPPHVEPWLLEAMCGDSVGAADECLTSGILVTVDAGTAFRHELARLAVEESLAPTRRVSLHREVLRTLERRVPLDPTRLAHHAEAAGDGQAVLEYAPLAAERAESAGAYREAAAQYGRALRFAHGLPPGRRAELLERRSEACYLADDQIEAIALLREAVECRRLDGSAGDRADALSRLTQYLVCRGLYDEAEEATDEATALASDEPESPELARAFTARALLRLNTHEVDEAMDFAERAIAIAERSGDEETLGQALVTYGTAASERDPTAGREMLERAVGEGRERGDVVQVARALNNLGRAGVVRRSHDLANTYLREAFDYCTEQNLDLWRINVLAYMSRSELDQGRWTEAADAAVLLLEDPRESPWPQFQAFLVLALVRARRGDPEAHVALDQARAIGAPADELESFGALAAAQAEIAWLEGRQDEVAAFTEDALDLAVRRRSSWWIGELAGWRRRARVDSVGIAEAAEPYALELAGDFAGSAACWAELGCPYEQVLALAGAGDEQLLRQAHDAARKLGARPLAKVVARRLRELGAHGVPSGPRSSTRDNPAQLTSREVEVLRLVADGLRNATIAERLYLSRRTVDHHVSAILRKLGASTRGEATATASKLGLLQAQ